MQSIIHKLRMRVCHQRTTCRRLRAVAPPMEARHWRHSLSYAAPRSAILSLVSCNCAAEQTAGTIPTTQNAMGGLLLSSLCCFLRLRCFHLQDALPLLGQRLLARAADAPCLQRPVGCLGLFYCLVAVSELCDVAQSFGIVVY